MASERMSPARLCRPISKAPFTRYNRFSNRLSNPFDNRLYRVCYIQPVVKPIVQLGLTTNRFDSRLYRVNGV